MGLHGLFSFTSVNIKISPPCSPLGVKREFKFRSCAVKPLLSFFYSAHKKVHFLTLYLFHFLKLYPPSKRAFPIRKSRHFLLSKSLNVEDITLTAAVRL
jgi:hypothetical protein